MLASKTLSMIEWIGLNFIINIITLFPFDMIEKFIIRFRTEVPHFINFV